jgi:hypothetical protein
MGNGVLYIGIGTFSLCNSLTNVTIPDSVRTVGDFAFHGCLALTHLNIGKNVTQMGPGLGYAFDGSTNLTSVVIPGNVTNIGSYAFSDSPNLSCVTIEDGVTCIGAHAFSVCGSLANVTLPASVLRRLRRVLSLHQPRRRLFQRGRPFSGGGADPFMAPPT